MKKKFLEKLNTIKKSKLNKESNNDLFTNVEEEISHVNKELETQDSELPVVLNENEEALEEVIINEDDNSTYVGEEISKDKINVITEEMIIDEVVEAEEEISQKSSVLDDNNSSAESIIEEVDEDTLKAKKLIDENHMDVIEALEHLDKLDGIDEEDIKSNKFKSFLGKRLIPISIVFFLFAMIGVSALFINMSTINVSIIIDDEHAGSIKQIGTLTTSDALLKAKVIPSSTDTISKPLDENLKNGDVINIKTASKVLVTNGKNIVKVDTGLTSPTEIVKQANFKVSKNKKISSIKHKNTSVYAILDKNQKLVNKSKKVKYKTVYKEVETLDGKDEKVLKQGENGKINFISVLTTNSKGKIVSSTNLTKTIERKVQNKVVAVAKDSKDTIMLPDANGKAPVKYNQKISVNVTAYCACIQCCGKTNAITASGTKAAPNRTIAAWSGLSFGTKVYFPSMANRPNGGIYTVEDRGGAIGPGRIDIYFSSHSEALSFGRRTIDAYILK